LHFSLDLALANSHDAKVTRLPATNRAKAVHAQ
jgi:hypothetical protein